MVLVAAPDAPTIARRSTAPLARSAVAGSCPVPPIVATSRGGSDVTALQEPVERPLTPEDVAALLQIDRETVYRMARRGERPAFKVSRRWRFLPSHLQRWMEQQEGRRT